MQKEKDKFLAIIGSTNFQFNCRYGLSYINNNQYIKISDSLSNLRRIKAFDSSEYHTLIKIFKHYLDNNYKVKYLISIEPRINAQLFIGKKKIREFIFKRDKYKCLCCGNIEHLSIDHIIPIHIGGENKLSNLQTLCKSCNSRKSTNIIDYR